MLYLHYRQYLQLDAQQTTSHAILQAGKRVDIPIHVESCLGFLRCAKEICPHLVYIYVLYI